MLVTDKKIDLWVKEGLLTADQANAIRNFEQSQKGGRSWVIYGITAIGIAAIAIGVISIVAGNWERIPPYTKLGVYILAQAGLGAALYRVLPVAGKVREAVMALFALFFFAGIGLTAQVFNISSNGWSGLLFWCGLTLPVVTLAGSRPLPYLWFIVLLIAETQWMLIEQQRFVRHMTEVQSRLTFASLSIYVFFAIGVLLPKVTKAAQHLAEACRVLSFLLLFVGGSFLGTVVWYVGYAELGSGMPANIIGTARFIPWIGLLLAAPAMLLRSSKADRKVAWALSVSFVMLAVFTTLPLVFALDAHRIAGTVLSILLWWSLAMAAVYAGRKRLFDLLTLAITIRLLVVYFEVFGSMLATGVGLIISGVLILFIAWIWYRFRDRLAEMVQRL